MISKDQLLDVGRIKKLNRGQTEKDYLIDLILHIITTNTKDELVFKGGTCLSKIYGMDRFSEDIDFTQKKELDLKKLSEDAIRDLKYFNIDATAKQKKVHDSITTRFRIKGPLYTGDDKSITTVRMDVNRKSTVSIPPKNKLISSLYPEIPKINVLSMDEQEILAEKIRALATRAKPRDLYDVNYLLEKNVRLDEELVEKKLGYYNEELDLSKMEDSIKNLENVWAKELKMLLRNPPEYAEVSQFVLKKLSLT